MLEVASPYEKKPFSYYMQDFYQASSTFSGGALPLSLKLLCVPYSVDAEQEQNILLGSHVLTASPKPQHIATVQLRHPTPRSSSVTAIAAIK